MNPTRIQLRRTAGWRLPANTIKVARPTRYGNPFVSSEVHPSGKAEIILASGIRQLVDAWWSAATVVDLYDQWMRGAPVRDPSHASPVLLVRRELLPAVPDLNPLRGRHLACWCAPDKPCHADVLLRMANDPEDTP